MIGERETKQNQSRRKRWDIFRLDVPLLIFLLVGWSLIFVVATLGLQRNTQQWLPINLVAQVSADYGPAANNTEFEPVDPDISEAVKEDARRLTPTLAVLVPETTPTAIGSPTPTATPRPGALIVSAGGPYSGDEGSTIVLAAEGFDSILSILPLPVNYRWDLDGDELYDDAEGNTTSVEFGDEGEYIVGVQASDLLGRVATDITTISVSNVPPTVNIVAVQDAYETETIAFLAEATDPGDDILFFEWNFGDGSPVINDTLRPEHAYPDDGDYVVLLRVRDNDGGITEDTLVVNVGNLPPLADAGPDQVTDEGSTITFRGTGDDPSEFDELDYAWDFDYDGNTFTPHKLGATASTVYSDGPARFVVALRVQDEDDGETIDTLEVRVSNVAPNIFAVTNDGPVGEGSPMTFRVTATDVGSDTLTYAFDWQNDGTFDTVEQSTTASHIWLNQGVYPVGIRVDDGDGGQDFITTTVTALNEPPVAIINSDDVALEGDPVLFDASESGDPGINDVLTYQWDFGDGGTANGVQPTHVYADNGVYTTTLTVTDDSAASSTAAATISILNANPVADAGPDLTVDEGVAVNFAGTASDPGAADTLSYAWDFDYDGLNFDVDAVGNSAVWTFPDGFENPETIVVAFRVQDDDYPFPTGSGGEVGEDIDTLRVTVENVPPDNVSAGGPYYGLVGKIVALTASQADDVPDDTLAYAWDLNYNGVTFDVDATGRTITHTWDSAGLYQIRLRVADEDGGRTFDTTTANINAVPTADAGGPYTGLEGSAINFDGSGSNDPDNDPLIYTWKFGDGSPTANGVNVTHAYADNGVYTATLTVRDSDGEIATATAGVTILNANPVADAGPDLIFDEGVQINLVGSAIDPGIADTLTYIWDFDYDGIIFDEEASGASTNVTYLDGPAIITVALRVQDDDYPFPTGGGGEIGEDLDTAIMTVNNKEPIVMAGGPYTGVEGQPVALKGSASDVAADTLTYEWDLDYDGFAFNVDATGQTVVNTWSTGGVYTVALRVTDSDGDFAIAVAEVDIDSIPTADAGGPYSGVEGSPITFDGSGSIDPDNDPLTYTWDFGDGGSPGTGINPTHTYADDGTYTVALQVDDGQGGIASGTAQVTVNNVPPTVDAGPDFTVDEGVAVNFAGTASDPGADTLMYQWDFDYDGSTFNVNATGQNVVTAYPDGPAVVTAALRVDDGDGGVVLDTALVTINNAAPIVDAGGPYTTTVGVPTTLSGNATDVPADTLSYTWDLDNDGTFETNGQIVTNIWTTPGIQTVTLRVADKDGDFGVDITTVDVGSPPTAEAGGPYSGDEGSPITFDGSGSSDPDGDPLTYSWDLDNDGTFETLGQVVSNIWPDEGVFTVGLRVADGRGGLATDTATVTVNNVPPIAQAGPNIAGLEGDLIAFDGSASTDPGINDILTYEWDFGDGSPIVGGINATHVYTDNGMYNATLTVTDDVGASDTDTVIVTIQNANPGAVASARPNPVDEGVLVIFDGSGSSDPGAGDTLTFEWDFDYDGSNFDVDASGQSASNTYADGPASFTVALRVRDDDYPAPTGGIGEDIVTLIVTVNNVVPVADAGGPYLTTVGATLTLTGSGDDVAADTLVYAWDLDNDSIFETPGQVVTKTWATAGTFPVSLQVTDDDGGVATDTTTVQVNGLAPFGWLGSLYLRRRGKRLIAQRKKRTFRHRSA